MTAVSTKKKTTNVTQRAIGQEIAPAITLILLATIIPEVLSGSIRITTLFALIPSMGVWGCGALIIRYLARRCRADWRSIFMMGLALAIAEECIIQQTSLAPLVGVQPDQVYSRAFGVNWLYLLWALGFESVWAVVIPILLTEIIFPSRREETWIGKRGLAIASVVFILASFNAWYFWTQMFVPEFFPASAYRPPLITFVIALTAIATLVTTALLRRPSRSNEQKNSRLAPQPLLVGLVSFILGLFWFLLILIAYGAVPALPVVIPLVGGLVIAGLIDFLFNLWSNSYGWSDVQRIALILGVMVATGLGGFVILEANVVFTMSNAPLVDRIGQLATSILGILLVIYLSRRPRFRQH